MDSHSRERQIYDFIVDYHEQNDLVPSTRKIADHIGISTNITRYYLDLLRARGAVDWIPNRPNTLQVIAPFE